MTGGALSRADLLSRGGKGAAVALASSAFGGFAAKADAATTPEGDLAYARLLVALELLLLDFYGNAIRVGKLHGGAQLELRRARVGERRHYELNAAILTEAGQVPATAADIDFTYPRGSFASRGSIDKLGVRLESLALGAYLGAVRALETPLYRDHAARAAASEAQHLSVFSEAVGGRRLGSPLPSALTIARVSDTLDRYTS